MSSVSDSVSDRVNLATNIEPSDRNTLFPVLKRILDILLGFVALILAIPIILVAGALIACDGRGCILYRQYRTGLYGRKFLMYKLRTMTVLENGECAVQCKTNDPRVTIVGRFLRKLGIDELPQLFNVIIGDMSLVGPRPHAQAQDNEFGAKMGAYMHRYRVKPGITGLAQVLGFRGSTDVPGSLERRIDADFEYIKHQSLELDLSIILRTVPAVLSFRQPDT